ncbi:hypothetical protein GCM10023081_04450 [Arthrobacter ginkgonis]|uniref:Uncharacterized protein n=1 Tax=Arthrobacter ginkgonis TaxID=1630594 RepID=A0ABP7BW28_9MICC
MMPWMDPRGISRDTASTAVKFCPAVVKTVETSRMLIMWPPQVVPRKRLPCPPPEKARNGAVNRTGRLVGEGFSIGPGISTVPRRAVAAASLSQVS